MSIRTPFIQLIAVLLLASAAVAQKPSPPLGDVVRAPKNEKKAAKIYTNDEIPSRTPEAAATPAQDSAAVATPTEPEASGDSKHSAADALLQELKGREGKLIQERDKLQQQLQSETEDLRKQALSEMLNVTSQDLEGVREYIALLSKRAPASKPDDTAQPGKSTPAQAPE